MASRSRDVDAGAKVVVLGQTVVEKLFGDRRTPSGSRCGSGSRRSSSPGSSRVRGPVADGQDYDDGAFIPMTTFARQIQGGLGKSSNGDLRAGDGVEHDPARVSG